MVWVSIDPPALVHDMGETSKVFAQRRVLSASCYLIRIALLSKKACRYLKVP